MKQLANRRALMIGLSAGAIGFAAVVVACSSSSGGNGSTPGGGSGSGSGGTSDTDGGSSVSTTPGTCANSTVAIDFAPMYSAFITDSTQHSFQIPAVVDDGSSAAWSASDPSKVQLAPDSTTGGLMITVQAAGTVDIIATLADGTCGKSTLNITSNIENDWTTGSARYNDGVALTLGPPAGGGNADGGGFTIPDGGFGEGGPQRPDGGGGFRENDGGSFFEEDGGTACTNCHGATASSAFKDVAHTPEQTGGFSDTDLQAIITQGIVPDGGYFDPTVLSATCTDAGTVLSPNMPTCGLRAYAEWQSIHKWNDISTPEQLTGIIVYLRSLTPTAQGGSSNFGGGGQHGDGGVHHHDGGGQPPATDSGSTDSTDAASE